MATDLRQVHAVAPNSTKLHTSWGRPETRGVDEEAIRDKRADRTQRRCRQVLPLVARAQGEVG